ncbi:MAG: hypothetical protein JW755_08150, partial [Candidatus Aminicenantes bacterium]|nr:hypothetical protein [Candidatus Aminicenantes bacterium]
VRLLEEILPKNTSLYFPLLSATFTWIVRREKEWKEKILNWQIWPDPDIVKTKSNDFILTFYLSHPELHDCYWVALEKKDYKKLRKDFCSLYPLIGLEDPFLTALFSKELKSQNYEKIVTEFDNRVNSAKKEIREIKNTDHLLTALEGFVRGISSLGAEFITQSRSRKALENIIKKLIEKKNE